MKYLKFLVFCVVATTLLGGLLFWQTRPQYFETDEYEGITTTTIRETNIMHNPETNESNRLFILKEGTPLRMTGKLYGTKGDVYYLSAEVIDMRDNKFWVPLTSLNAALHGA